MARTQGDILQLQIGGLVMQLADAMSKLEQMQEVNEKLQAEITKLKPPEPVREPDKAANAAEKPVVQAPKLVQEVKK